mmetsp:Transcript_8736/g.27934  ORF Transcript_8736/g.27934 Transcript_8736/m.27934 type:complete len:87 (-) Transcript_8736:793-1053(-)
MGSGQVVMTQAGTAQEAPPRPEAPMAAAPWQKLRGSVQQEAVVVPCERSVQAEPVQDGWPYFLRPSSDQAALARFCCLADRWNPAR